MLSLRPELTQRQQLTRYWFEFDEGGCVILLGLNSAAVYENHSLCPYRELFILTIVLCLKHLSLLSGQKTGFTPDTVPLPTRTSPQTLIKGATPYREGR